MKRYLGSKGSTLKHRSNLKTIKTEWRQIMNKILQKMLALALELNTWVVCLDNGTQFKIVDRVMARSDKFLTEERALENLFDVIIDEIFNAGRELKKHK